jgi:hypothetical protein
MNSSQLLALINNVVLVKKGIVIDEDSAKSAISLMGVKGDDIAICAQYRFDGSEADTPTYIKIFEDAEDAYLEKAASIMDAQVRALLANQVDGFDPASFGILQSDVILIDEYPILVVERADVSVNDEGVVTKRQLFSAMSSGPTGSFVDDITQEPSYCETAVCELLENITKEDLKTELFLRAMFNKALNCNNANLSNYSVLMQNHPLEKSVLSPFQDARPTTEKLKHLSIEEMLTVYSCSPQTAKIVIEAVVEVTDDWRVVCRSAGVANDVVVEREASIETARDHLINFLLAEEKDEEIDATAELSMDISQRD